MIRKAFFALLLLSSGLAVPPARAEDTPVPDAVAVPEAGARAGATLSETGSIERPSAAPEQPGRAESGGSPAETALAAAVSALPPGDNDEERNERAAIAAFYEARAYAPLWVEARGLGEKAAAAVDEIRRADDWGLKAADFALPSIGTAAGATSDLAADAAVDAEVELTLAVLKYARFARGGRIISPTDLLSTQLDRRPQLIKPEEVLAGMSAADDGAAYLRSLHPQHPQFERLRQKYLALRDKVGRDAKRILANMEEWRWMPADMGDLHVLANVPEFMIYVYKYGEPIHSERIVAGELDKQTAVFTRRLKHIVFRPMWRVPESIKVRELMPSLKRGGGLMRQYGLEVETKDGRRLDWRTMDWSNTDIRDFEVVQPPGPKSVLGVVKFSFPSQHTIYMHDTPDKWMFNSSQRTLSHGCLRVRKPVELAHILLAEDKGLSRAEIDEMIRNGPLNNEIAIEGKIPIHLVYFTAWVDGGGRLKTAPDVYGHEKRITQALDGRWSEIDKGRDHLAPVEDVAVSTVSVGPSRRAKKSQTALDDFMNSLTGGF